MLINFKLISASVLKTPLCSTQSGDTIAAPPFTAFCKMPKVQLEISLFLIPSSGFQNLCQFNNKDLSLLLG